MESKHTPGPWEVTPCTAPSGWGVNANHAGLLDIGEQSKNAEADAQLIAAAPDMYEALERIFFCAYDDNTPLEAIVADFDAMREVARMALAKAEGR